MYPESIGPRPPLRIVAAVAFAALAVSAPPSVAGEIYCITSTDGKTTMSYDVRFGGTRSVGQFTAYCPKQRKFVYLTWKRGEKPPDPVARIWDHRTGETIGLYKFAGCDDPLPVIPSVEDLKVCPFTGDKRPKKKLSALLD